MKAKNTTADARITPLMPNSPNFPVLGGMKGVYLARLRYAKPTAITMITITTFTATITPFTRTRSKALQQRAERFFPGGVNSPVRAFRAVGGAPPFVESAAGAYLTDADGNRYIDYFGSWGPMILGHAFPPVVEAIQRAAKDSASFGASTAAEADLAERITACYPAIEKMRFVSSGTEATMSAIRLARAATGRKIIVK